jgi:hypothetical protein
MAYVLNAPRALDQMWMNQMAGRNPCNRPMPCQTTVAQFVEFLTGGRQGRAYVYALPERAFTVPEIILVMHVGGPGEPSYVHRCQGSTKLISFHDERPPSE